MRIMFRSTGVFENTVLRRMFGFKGVLEDRVMRKKMFRSNEVSEIRMQRK